jgi:hypothetical protein
MSRNKVIAVVVGVVAVGAIALVIALWNFAAPPQAGGSTPSATAPADPSTPPSETVPPTPSEWPTPEPGETDEVDPGEPIEVEIDEDATVADGISARITGVRSFDAEDSEQPGQLAGPAVEITIEVTNNLDDDIDLTGASVNVDYGDDRTPAPSIGDPVATGLPSSLASGKSARGEYSFSLPLDVREHVRVILDLVSGEPQVIFVGKMTGD